MASNKSDELLARRRTVRRTYYSDPKIVIVRIGEQNKGLVHPYSSAAYEMKSSAGEDRDVPSFFSIVTSELIPRHGSYRSLFTFARPASKTRTGLVPIVFRRRDNLPIYLLTSLDDSRCNAGSTLGRSAREQKQLDSTIFLARH